MGLVNEIITKVAAAGTIGAAVFFGSEIKEHYWPKEDYKIEQKCGSNVIYNKQGDIFVKADYDNLLNYIKKQNADEVRDTLERLESVVMRRDYSNELQDKRDDLINYK